MEFSPERARLVEKMFDAALKEKMNQLVKKYGHGLVFELWTRMATGGCIKPYSCPWKWKPNMTITEALDCLDEYCNELENLLRMSQEFRPTTPDGKDKNNGTDHQPRS